jgi:hypothetical protein
MKAISANFFSFAYENKDKKTFIRIKKISIHKSPTINVSVRPNNIQHKGYLLSTGLQNHKENIIHRHIGKYTKMQSCNINIIYLWHQKLFVLVSNREQKTLLHWVETGGICPNTYMVSLVAWHTILCICMIAFVSKNQSTNVLHGSIHRFFTECVDRNKCYYNSAFLATA